MKFEPMKSPVLKIIFLAALLVSPRLQAQSNITLRVMSANITSGTGQSYETAGINIFQGLKPDVVAIQEFRYNSSSTSSSLRTLVDTAFGTNFDFYCESSQFSYNIPNGIVSRWPIIAAGSLDDPTVSDRGIAWAKIQLPGTNDLYVISVHLYGSGSAADRNTEAMVVTNFIGTNCPVGSWVVVGGDFNTSSRSEACVTTLKNYLSDYPIPDDNGLTPDQDTNEPRNKPYDYVLASFAFTNLQTAVTLPSHTLPNGLVFDSAVYAPLSDVSPVASGDSHVTGMQHMAVVKDFSFTVGPNTNPPSITLQPQGRTNAVGSAISFSVIANGGGTLNYQWLFNDTNIAGATANQYVLANAQLTNNGNYSVVITNLYGSATSSTAILLVTNAPPAITVQPQNQVAIGGQSATFSVTATGTSPLNYQWLFNGTNISGATTNPFVIPSAQQTDAGNYSVAITNIVGSVTSSAASLTIVFTNPVIFAQWNFNSVPADSNTASGTSSPSIGSGTASLVGGTTSTFATGNTNLDPAFTNDNSAWNTSTYPASTSNNRSAGAQFAVSTAGKQNIVISWSQQSSRTGGKYFRMLYSTNNGATFTNFLTTCTLPLGTNFYAFTNDLSTMPTVNNNSNFIFRIVGEFESTAIGSANGNYVAAQPGSTYATSGTTRFDMVSVSGTSYIVATNAALTPAAFASGQFNFNIAGSTGASYVIQTSTNLSSTNWISIYTNISPFSFADTNPTDPQKFYRAVSGQ